MPNKLADSMGKNPFANADATDENIPQIDQ